MAKPPTSPADTQAQDLPTEPGARIALLSIVGFWVFYGLIATMRAVIMEFPSPGEMLVRRAIVTAVSIVITMGLWQLLRLFAGRPLRQQVLAIALLAIPFAILSGMSNYYFFNVYDPGSLIDVEKMRLPEDLRPTALQEIGEASISRYFFLMAWSAFYVAIGYAERAKATERRIAAFARAAQTAELRALRYQVNPHFLFNTLNSLSALVMNDRRREAETMIMNLSTFYRTSLAGEPTEDVPLADEVALQSLYLDIEKVRFPDRLSVAIDVPEALAAVPVPGLILQPVVENAVKHGVASVSGPVTVRLSARAEGALLRITVSDTGRSNGTARHPGNGIGLANVRDRLAARFGDRATLKAGPGPDGGYQVTMHVPMEADHD